MAEAVKRRGTSRSNLRNYSKIYNEHTPYYSQGSAARQISVQEEYIPIPQPRPAVKPKRSLRKRRKAEFAYDIQTKHREYFMSYILLIAFFGGLALILSLNAQFRDGQLKLEAARSQLVSLIESNDAILSGIYANLDMYEIERFATEELGMIRPEEFQLIEIRLPRRSYFTHVATGELEANNVSSNRFLDTLISFVNSD